MTRLILIIAIVAGLWIIYHLGRQKVKRQGRGALIKPVLFVLAGLLILAAITGKAHLLFALVGAAIPFIGRLTPLLRFWPMLRQLHSRYKKTPGNGNQSNARTAWLAMTLDHDSGEIDGKILCGAFAGRTLSSLNLDELKQFYADCQQHDVEALRLLNTYIQREHAGEWDPANTGNEQTAYASGDMRVADAWEILGLPAGASRKDIIDTHRRLMSKLHPDKGGSNYLASQINQAKDLLLKEASNV